MTRLDATGGGDDAPDSRGTPAAGVGTPRNLGRRAFLGLTLGGGALAALGMAGDWFRMRTRFLWEARAVENYARAYTYPHLPTAERIRRHFDYLTIDEAGLERFVREYEKVYGPVELGNMEGNRLLYTKFLMSTDFFPNGADESRPVRFVALHDPYASPCWSPFAPRS